MTDLATYQTKTGRFEPVWTLEIQCFPEDCDRVLDAIMQVYTLSYGRYQRNASMTAVGKETSQPEPESTTTSHKPGYEAGATETYPMVELKVSLPRDLAILGKVMDHH